MPSDFAPCEVTLAFGDGDYLFKLPLKQIAELQLNVRTATGVDSPFGLIYRRVTTGNYYIQDLNETIRLGLIGGGCDPLKARVLCENYVEVMPKEQLWKHAAAILAACAQGYEPKDRPPPKQVGETG
jgi:hypothetical protein